MKELIFAMFKNTKKDLYMRKSLEKNSQGKMKILLINQLPIQDEFLSLPSKQNQRKGKSLLVAQAYNKKIQINLISSNQLQQIAKYLLTLKIRSNLMMNSVHSWLNMTRRRCFLLIDKLIASTI